jgi:TolB-like protein/tetratricopeptide (TPR) repeat protein
MIGQTISHYRIMSKLGEGGMGVVYRAEDLSLGRHVALKFIQPGLADEKTRQRFMREAQAASAIDHPNICAIHEIGEAPDGRLFLVMPCYQGESLRTRLSRGALPVDEALEIAVQAGAGLERAHRAGIVHRDIKPANLLLTADGLVKILDFGLARLGGRTRLTRSRSIVGTVAYMAPEQVRGGDVDHRADLWALGVLLYEMLAGEPPFQAEHEQALMYAILNQEPLPIRRRRSESPLELEHLLAKALAKSPDERYRGAARLTGELRVLQERLGARALPAADGEPASADAMTAEYGDAERVPAVAVLPFVSMSADPEDQYFGDGLAEELINALAQVGGLRVVARTSAFRFRGSDVDIREIGEKLNVAAVLEGSVRRAGDRLRVTAQLIDVRDGYHLWSERYDRRLEDIFEVQDEITRAIVQKLEVKLLGRKDRQFVRRHTSNVEAYNAFLKARYSLHKLTPEGWAQCHELLQEAIALDPEFALPYEVLSDAYGSQAWWGGAAPWEAMPKVRRAAERALALDAGLALAHNNLGLYSWLYDRDLAAAERSMRESVALDPNDAQCRIAFGLLLSVLSQYREAIEHGRAALKLDPLSALIAAWGGAVLSCAGQPEEAVAVFERGIELDPGHWQLHFHYGGCLLYLERDEAAAASLERAVELSGGAAVAVAFLAMAQHLCGLHEKAEQMTSELRERAGREYVSPCFFGWLCVTRGEPAAALPYLEQALKDRDIYVATNGLWAPRIRMRGPEVEARLAEAGLV